MGMRRNPVVLFESTGKRVGPLHFFSLVESVRPRKKTRRLPLRLKQVLSDRPGAREKGGSHASGMPYTSKNGTTVPDFSVMPHRWVHGELSGCKLCTPCVTGCAPLAPCAVCPSPLPAN